MPAVRAMASRVPVAITLLLLTPLLLSPLAAIATRPSFLTTTLRLSRPASARTSTPSPSPSPPPPPPPPPSSSFPAEGNTSRRAVEPGQTVTPEPGEPPPELFPPPRADLPRLVAAGHDSLRFEITIPCEEPCPDVVYWHYKEDGSSTDWNEKSESTKTDSSFCKSTLSLETLKVSTKYVVRAQPVTTSKGAIKTIDNWYKKSPTQPFSPIVSGSTCPAEVSPVEDLLVHSVGFRWLALSWLPPSSPCLTEFGYKVKVKPVLTVGNYQFKGMGSFWSNASWAVKEPVMPCTAWPDRHCLLVEEDSKQTPIAHNTEYEINVRVIRTVDTSLSKPIRILQETTDLAPGPPEDLRCVKAEPTKLKLRWRSPLRPGGVLTFAHVRVTLANDTVVHNFTPQITLRSVYEWEVDNLQPMMFYKVYVGFGTKAGLNGSEKHIEVWTPPTKGYVDPDDPCQSRSPRPSAALPTAKGVYDRGGGGSGVAWGWWVTCIALLLLVVAALFVGRRWGSRGLWILARNDDSKSSSGVGSGTSSNGDETSLCGSPLTQPSGTPPSSVQEYTEVGLPWTKQPRSPGHDYEELKGGARIAEQPYAEVGHATEPLQPCYTEVRRPGARPPPVTANPMPVYAQVDKKRAPPLPPPPGPRLVLQDSD